MSDVRPGWYTDPRGTRQERYFDGTDWTEQVRPTRGAAGGVHGLEQVGPYGGGPAYGSAGAAASGGGYGGAPTTPDGQLLAGWWRRVGASIIDSFVLIPMVVVVGWPFYSNIIDRYSAFIDETITAAERNQPGPSQMDLQSDLLGDFVAVGLIGLVVNFVYVVGMLAWKQGTLGKLALGMRVRLRDQPGPIPLGRILVRWGAQSGPSAFVLVPLVSCAVYLYQFLDVLWPLWDDKKQAIHDKAAGTNVVMHRA